MHYRDRGATLDWSGGGGRGEKQGRMQGVAHAAPQEPERSAWRDLEWYKITWWCYDWQFKCIFNSLRTSIFNFFFQGSMSPRVFGTCVSYYPNINYLVPVLEVCTPSPHSHENSWLRVWDGWQADSKWQGGVLKALFSQLLFIVFKKVLGL